PFVVVGLVPAVVLLSSRHCMGARSKTGAVAACTLPDCNCSGGRDLDRQIRRNFCSSFCPRSSSGSARDCFRSAARLSKRQLSQYFSSTDSALLWLRRCAQCLNSLR